MSPYKHCCVAHIDIVSLSTSSLPCNSMQLYTTPCNSMHLHATPCNSMQLHATPCNSIQLHATPCNSIQLHATPCISMQLHTTPCNSIQLHATPCISMQLYATPCNLQSDTAQVLYINRNHDPPMTSSSITLLSTLLEQCYYEPPLSTTSIVTSHTFISIHRIETVVANTLPRCVSGWVVVLAKVVIVRGLCSAEMDAYSPHFSSIHHSAPQLNSKSVCVLVCVSPSSSMLLFVYDFFKNVIFNVVSLL